MFVQCSESTFSHGVFFSFVIVRDPAFLSVGWEQDGREGACEAKTRSSACFIWVPGERDYGAGMQC